MSVSKTPLFNSSEISAATYLEFWPETTTASRYLLDSSRSIAAWIFSSLAFLSWSVTTATLWGVSSLLASIRFSSWERPNANILCVSCSEDGTAERSSD